MPFHCILSQKELILSIKMLRFVVVCVVFQDTLIHFTLMLFKLVINAIFVAVQISM
jgi:hypothetical protein